MTLTPEAETLVPPPETRPPKVRSRPGLGMLDGPIMRRAIADSSTAAMPSTTSPSPGMIWPGPTTQRSPTLRRLDGVSTTASSDWRT